MRGSKKLQALERNARPLPPPGFNNLAFEEELHCTESPSGVAINGNGAGELGEGTLSLALITGLTGGECVMSNKRKIITKLIRRLVENIHFLNTLSIADEKRLYSVFSCRVRLNIWLTLTSVDGLIYIYINLGWFLAHLLSEFMQETDWKRLAKCYFKPL